MSRFLFVSLPLPGHAYPTAALAATMREAGHEVAWVGAERFLRPYLGPEAVIYRTGLRPYRGQLLIGARAVRSLWEEFLVPHTRFLLPRVEEAVADWRPDALLVDQHAFAGGLVAHRHRLPWATFAPGMMEMTRPFQHRPRVDGWIRGHLAGLWRAADLPGEPPFDLRFSPHLVIASITTALTGDCGFDDRYAMVGPFLVSRSEGGDFPWQWLATDRKKLLVTMGTLTQDLARGFYRRVTEALAPLADTLQAVLVCPPDTVPEPPPHLLVVDRAPVLSLLPRLDAVVCHAGQNTVCEALAHGLPLVVAPISRDQPISAGQVTGAGAAIRLRFHRASPAELRQAILTVLSDQSYAAAARRVADSFTAAGGVRAAAARLAALAA